MGADWCSWDRRPEELLVVVHIINIVRLLLRPLCDKLGEVLPVCLRKDLERLVIEDPLYPLIKMLAQQVHLIEALL